MQRQASITAEKAVFSVLTMADASMRLVAKFIRHPPGHPVRAALQFFAGRSPDWRLDTYNAFP
ncbi:hypothetical protein GCM10008943_21390 [Paenochrobactrum glaciei]|uniref:Transposase n=1 Tax=Paenochrobactrum glaciei TaxID=486407 RepID=A0ABP3RA10_9HYPH